jgi:transposase-like protein
LLWNRPAAPFIVRGMSGSATCYWPQARATETEPGRNLQPLAEARFASGVRCAHCKSARVQRWGRRAGRQRYRCGDCRRTFSDFTGTLLAHCKRIDRVAAYCEILLRGETVRASARQCGIHRTTAFRWRHLLLDHLRLGAATPLQGVAEIIELRFLHSEKGARKLDRPPYRRGERGFAVNRPRYWALLVRDRRGMTMSMAIGSRPPTIAQLGSLLSSPPHFVTELIAPAGTFSPYANICTQQGWAFRQAIHATRRGAVTPLAHTRNAVATAARLRRWMLRFRGVASRYLDNYLRWHDLVDEANRTATEVVIASAIARI